MTSSPLHTADVFTADGFGWASTAALGRLDLATVPSKLPGRDAVVASVVAGADRYVANQAAQPWGSVYSPSGDYVWGSSSQVANNLVVVGTAFDLTGDEKYRRSVLEGVDYLLGRNALNQSYVTGWGEVASHQQHNRWWAHELDPALPSPPAGSLAGGPNSQAGTWDPTTQAAFPAGCAPSACYIDEIGAWSTNEVAINWQSAISWVASFLADQDGGEPVQVAPAITTQPKDARGKLGATVTYTAAASGTPVPTVKWQVRWCGGRWVTIPGATKPTLTLPVTLLGVGSEYRAVFTNAAGTATTRAAAMTVVLPWQKR